MNRHHRGTLASRGSQPTMTDTSTNDTGVAPGSASSATRLERFARDLDAIGHRTSRGDRRFVFAGVTAMVLGVVVSLVAYIVSTGQTDQRDVISSAILAVVGLTVVVAGGALFVRSSITEFLRFWMLRLLAEQRHDDVGEERR